MHVIYLRPRLDSVRPSACNSQKAGYNHVWFGRSVLQVTKKRRHVKFKRHSAGNCSRAVIRDGTGRVSRYKSTAWTSEDQGSFPVRGIRDFPPLHNLRTGSTAFLASYASCGSSVPENIAAEA
jgi:hypothetical protein